MADKFRTQDGPLTGVVSYLIRIPGNLWFAAEVSDLLHDMCDPENWIESGTVTIDEAVEASTNMYLGFGTMIGQLIPFVTTALPENCLLCDGASYLRVDYPALYAALDSVFIVDADNFIVPDLRDRFPIGAGNLYATGDTGGEAEHTLVTSEVPAHNHTDNGHLHADHSHLTVATLTPVGAVPISTPSPFPGATTSASADIQDTGGGAAHNNLPPYIGISWGIVAQ